ncbi:MAG: flagellin FliC [Planctomycetes bacterium]|nr:flagellin FliC [Planctomycetota bacterium]
MLSFFQSNSLFVRRQLDLAGGEIQKSLERLSSGLRIVHASDDPAGLGMSERLRGLIASYSGVHRNIDQGLGLVRTADGMLGEVSNLLTRLREIATRAANDTLTAVDRSALQTEFQGLAGEVRRIIDTGEFDGNGLFNTNTALNLQVGPTPTSVLAIPRLDLRATAAALTTVNLTTPAGVTAAVNGLNTFQSTVTGLIGVVGTTSQRLESLMRTADVTRDNLSQAESRIRDVDVAEEAARLTRNQVMQAAAAALLAQANIQPEVPLSLLDFRGG